VFGGRGDWFADNQEVGELVEWRGGFLGHMVELHSCHHDEGGGEREKEKKKLSEM